AAIPLAVPGMLLDVLLQLAGLSETTFGQGRVVVSTGQVRKPPEHVVEEESQPDTFAASLLPHHIHAVIPVAATDQGEAVGAETQSTFDGAHTMVVECGRFFGAIGQIVVGLLLRLDR